MIKYPYNQSFGNLETERKNHIIMIKIEHISNCSLHKSDLLINVILLQILTTRNSDNGCRNKDIEHKMGKTDKIAANNWLT